MQKVHTIAKALQSIFYLQLFKKNVNELTQIFINIIYFNILLSLYAFQNRRMRKMMFVEIS